PARACASAIEMRRTLRSVGRITARSSNVGLRMSVGVHSGAYELFLVGGERREYVIAGPAASKVVAIEAAAGAGQILISDQTAERIPDSRRGERRGPGHLLARAPAVRVVDSADDGPFRPDDEQIAGCL